MQGALRRQVSDGGDENVCRAGALLLPRARQPQNTEISQEAAGAEPLPYGDDGGTHGYRICIFIKILTAKNAKNTKIFIINILWL